MWIIVNDESAYHWYFYSKDEPDYDKKLFDDDTPAATNHTDAKDQRNHHPTPAQLSNSKAGSVEEEMQAKADRDGKWADNIQAQGRAIAPTPPQVQVLTRDRSGGFPSGEIRRERPLSIEEDELLRHQKSVEMKAAQRAKEKR